MNVISIQRTKWIGVLLIAVASFLVYSNTFSSSWHLDDYDNILKNPGIHLNDLYPRSVIQSFHASIDGGAYRGDSLYRPVPMFTFAVNWYLGQSDVHGYHVVNLMIHIVSGILLFMTMDLMLQSPNIKTSDPKTRHQIALLAALIWAIHPIQTSAVTYIVQRMASMAGMFYVAGLLLYLKFRYASGYLKKSVFILLYIITFALAMGTKQNSILLPFATVLMEVVCFRRMSSRMWRKVLGIGLIISVFAFIYVYFWTGGNVASLLNGYETRPYSPMERLYTQFRVVCFYLYQLFYPVTSNFSAEHEFIISRSLISPWTTLTAAGFILALIISGIISVRKYPTIGFSILFFFLNHTVESSILNLEIVFEHRNYIPSMFLFLPPAYYIVMFFDHLEKTGEKRLLRAIAVLSVMAWIFIVGMATFSRNSDWQTEKSLWEDALEKAPGRARPYQSIATYYYQAKGAWDDAIPLLQTALDKDDSKPASSKMVSYENLRYCYLQKGDKEKAVEYGQLAVKAKPGTGIVFNYIETLLLAEKIDLAADSIRRYLSNKEPSTEELNLQTLIFLKQQKGEKAFDSALQAIKKSPMEPNAMTYFGYACLVSHRYEKADHYLNKVRKKSRFPLYIGLCLVQNRLNQGDRGGAELYLKELVARFSLDDIQNKLGQVGTETYPLVKLSIETIRGGLSQLIISKVNHGLF